MNSKFTFEKQKKNEKNYLNASGARSKGSEEQRIQTQ